jgi:hypothetical protein
MVIMMLNNMSTGYEVTKDACTMLSQGIFATYLLANLPQTAWDPYFSTHPSNGIFHKLCKIVHSFNYVAIQVTVSRLCSAQYLGIPIQAHTISDSHPYCGSWVAIMGVEV